jgi:hypothetical protein
MWQYWCVLRRWNRKWASVALAGSALALFGGLLSACSNSQAGALRTYTIGPPGHQIHVDASPLQEPRTTSDVSPPSTDALVPGVLTNYGASLSLPGGGKVQVQINISSFSIPKARRHWIIDSFFNNTPEKPTTWHGVPADLGVVSCVTPSGSCPGYDGGVTVVRGTALYNVFIHSGSSSTAWAVIHSFAVN